MHLEIQNTNDEAASASDAIVVLELRPGQRISVMPVLVATATTPEWPFSVRMMLGFSTREVRFNVRSVTVTMKYTAERDRAAEDPEFADADDVSSTLLRAVRVSEIARLAAAGGIFLRLAETAPPVSLLDWWGPTGAFDFSSDLKEAVGGRGPNERILGLVAFTYQLARVSSQPPAKAVESSFGIPVRTAVRWIARAKELGFLDTPRIFVPKPAATSTDEAIDG